MIRTLKFTALAIITVLFAGEAAHAQEKPVIPPQKFVYCSVCHGINLGGNTVIHAPRLSGMAPWYAKRQLIAFKEGRRGTHDDDTYGQEMRPMAAVLSADDIVAVTDYINAVSSAAVESTVDGDATRGKSLYGSCIACHGKNAEGNEALGGPALTGINDWYLLTQLENFKSGVRGNADGDIYGQQMQAAAQLLSDEQAMRDVVRYIDSLGN